MKSVSGSSVRHSVLPIGDLLLLSLSLLITVSQRYPNDWRWEYLNHLVPFGVLFSLWLMVFYITHQYEVNLSAGVLSYLSSFMHAMIANSVIAVSFFYVSPIAGITPKTNLVIFLTLATGLLGAWRYAYSALIYAGRFHQNLLIVGVGPQSESLARFMKNNPQFGFNCVGVLDWVSFEDATALENIVRKRNIAVIVLAPSVYAAPHVVSLMYRLLPLGVQFEDLLDFHEAITGKVLLGEVDQAWFLRNFNAKPSAFELAKRGCDLLFAVSLSVLSLPLYPLIIAAIKLDSPGSAFFRQKRVGRAGKTFTLYKFRTMRIDAEKHGPKWASELDDRTTRLGGFLRRSRLDELPQTWNLILGDLSLVGPRPERPEFHEELKKAIPFYEERYFTRPGLTGWAQIKFKLDFAGGMTVEDTLEKVQYDLYYIKHQSLLLDLAIAMHTIYIISRKVLSRRAVAGADSRIAVR
jgi:exopolysaccharide biosynthesis polyprenyl glycosylphosphotransferase